MHKIFKLILILFCFLPTMMATNVMAAGAGKLTLGYTFEDETGNQSVQHSSFNRYEGLEISLENFRYKFDNGFQLDADLKRITLNNRDIRLSLRKSGLLGVSLTNHQYRRVYDFDGNDFTRRHRTQASFWFLPHKFIKIFAKGNFSSESGRMSNFYEPGYTISSVPVDYDSRTFELGARYNRQGQMFSAEYFGGTFSDANNTARDRTRNRIKFFGMMPLPNYEWAIISGGFQHFQNKYDLAVYKISSNRSWGGLRLNLRRDFFVNYHFVFDRTGSDSDFVATDNLSHALYVTRAIQDKARFTLGYQNDINDDFAGEVNSDTYYISAWLKPIRQLELKGEYGSRIEKLTDGFRLLGHEDRERFNIGATYRILDAGAVSLKFNRRNRKNERLNSEYDFDRFSLTGNMMNSIGKVDVGYSFSEGEYLNNEQSYDFNNHTFYGNLTLNEYRGLTVALGTIYSRGKRDLDIESINFSVSLSYEITDKYNLEINYFAHNFDDFLLRDQYYTSNTVELNLSRDISF